MNGLPIPERLNCIAGSIVSNLTIHIFDETGIEIDPGDSLLTNSSMSLQGEWRSSSQDIPTSPEPRKKKHGGVKKKQKSSFNFELPDIKVNAL